MNIIPLEFNYPNIKIQDLEKQAKELYQANGERKKTCSFKHPMPYNQRKFIGHNSNFGFKQFYHFLFKKDRNQTNQLLGSLSNTSTKTKTTYTIEENQKQNYKVKFGIRTAAQPKFSTLSRSYKKYQFHFGND